MLGIFRKKPLRSQFYPREERVPLEGQVFIKRIGMVTLRACRGNISKGGLYVEITNHDMERGKKVEIILVKEEGAIRRLTRMMGITIRVDKKGAAFVTYKKEDIHSEKDVKHEEALLQQEFGTL